MSDRDPTRRYLLTSVARIADFSVQPFDVVPLERGAWSAGDYIAARVVGPPGALYRIELPSGRQVRLLEGERLLGAFGRREATLEGCGSWEAIGADGRLHALTGAGLLGLATSSSTLVPPLMQLAYEGHVCRDDTKLCMADFVPALPPRQLECPVVLLVGTSMSAGKTTTGRIIINELRNAGLRVLGAKFTGAARYRDTLSFGDAGAVEILDFVDAGLPSTVVPPDDFRAAMRWMLSRAAAAAPDVVVAEAGASPLEPYNGDIAIEALRGRLAFTALCASDPYAVVGVQSAFGILPDLVTGPAANTSAAVELVHRLTGLPAHDLLRAESLPALRALLRRAIPALTRH